MRRGVLTVAMAGVVGLAGMGVFGQEVPATRSIRADLANIPAPTTQAKPPEPRNDTSTTTGVLLTAAIGGGAEGPVTGGGREITYTAVSGYMPLKDEREKLRANIFYVAYTMGTVAVAETGRGGGVVTTRPASTASVGADTRRPVTFLFNGGPGAASAWLHIGGVGPRRIAMPEDGAPPKAPFKVIDNEFSWLPATDLVFVDPVNTGYSRAATPEQEKEFFGVKEDIAAMGEFIRLYMTKNGRWGSPVFLAGESYGTTRAAGLASYLQDRVGISVSGLMLVSTVLNFSMLMPSEGNDAPFPLYLPSLAATAWYHKKAGAGKSLEAWLKEAETYAISDYTVALARGAGLSAEERSQVAGRLSELMGLRKEYVLESNLRVLPARFEKELLRSATGEGSKIVGRFDGRLTGWPVDGGSAEQDYDPSLSGFFTAYTSAFNEYVRRQLKYENDLAYEVLSNKVYPWNFGSRGVDAGTGFLYVGDSLRDAMTQNPNMKVLVCSGRFDLATPYFATDYQLSHLTLAPELRKNIRTEYYAGGHMMYHVRTELEKLYRDTMRFVEGAK